MQAPGKDGPAKPQWEAFGPNLPPVWTLPFEDVFARLGAEPRGLRAEEAARRLRNVGPNRLPDKPPRSLIGLLLAQLKGFLTLLLCAAAVVAWAIGDLKDAIMVATVTVFNAVLGFVQEHRAEQALAALQRMMAFRARARRDGQVSELPADELVPGDVVLLEAGDRVPADGRLFFAHGCEMDESALTGESAPTRKSAAPALPLATPLGERHDVVFMNSVVTRGRAEFVVSATGCGTEMGRIAGMLEGTMPAPTPLQLQLDFLAKRLAVATGLVVGVIALLELVRGNSLAKVAMEAVALAVAAVPEGLPVVVTVTLALGLHRMARQRAIVKQLAAVETLGCTTVIGADKTGTLTMNQMTVRRVWFAGAAYAVTGEGYGADGEVKSPESGRTARDLTPLLRAVVLCNDSRIHGGVLIGDPTEGALVALAAKAGLAVQELRRASPRIGEVSFESERRFMATFHRDGDVVHVYAKGAPGALLDRSTRTLLATGEGPLDDAGRQRLRAENDAVAADGLRVLAVGMREISAQRFEETEELTELVKELTFLGLVGMLDPPRAEARDAILRCERAGIAVKMLTGDQRPTAVAVARALGLVGDAITGAELDGMDDSMLAAILPSVAVFARVSPEHKLRIVTALQARKHVVAVTGDGVNDAPALRKADIGVAMGSGTEVAKGAASMVLTDDNFATIVRAVQEGRTIYDNIVKFVRFQLSTNLGALLTVLVAPFFGLESPLGAIQILWVAMISDGPPAVALGLDAARADVMNEPPRHPAARILTWSRFSVLLFHGAIMTGGTLALVHFGRTLAPGRESTLAFSAFVLFQIFNAFNVRSENGTSLKRATMTNYRLWVALGGVVALQAAVVHSPPLERLFGTSPLTMAEWALAAGTASTVLVLEELRKLFVRAAAAHAVRP